MRRTLFPLAALLLTALLGAACAKSDTVPLTYALGMTKPGCAGELVVLAFADERANAQLGVDRDGQPLTTDSDAADWVGWALFDELKAAGCEPRYRTSVDGAGVAPVVTGQVLETRLDQTGLTTYVAAVSVRLEVRRGDQIVHVERFSSQVEDLVTPGYSSRREILAEALRGLMAEAVPAVSAALLR